MKMLSSLKTIPLEAKIMKFFNVKRDALFYVSVDYLT